MKAIMRAELLKLATTRLWWLMLLLALALTVVTTSAAISFDEPGPLSLQTAAGQRIVVAQGSVATLIMAVLGIVAVTGERGHQTITPTFLATPRRDRIVLGKMITYAVVGVGYAAACSAVALAVALPWLAGRNVPFVLSPSDTLVSMVGVAAEVTLYAVLGVAIGTLVGNQIAAVVGFVVYLFVVGPILSGLQATSQIAQFLPWQAGNSLARLPPWEDAVMLPQWPGGLVLLGWAVLLAALGTRLTVRRDVT